MSTNIEELEILVSMISYRHTPLTCRLWEDSTDKSETSRAGTHNTSFCRTSASSLSKFRRMGKVNEFLPIAILRVHRGLVEM